MIETKSFLDYFEVSKIAEQIALVNLNPPINVSKLTLLIPVLL